MYESVVAATLAYMEHLPPPAEELALLDRELVQLDTRRVQLLNRRAWLLSVLQQQAAPVPPFPAHVPQAAGRYSAPLRPGGPGQAAVPRSAQNVLLSLGGLLLIIAAIAFTLVSWGAMGIGGRSAVLAAVTVGALVAPAVLLKRGLSSTAESLAALALVLTVLDAYALHAVAAPDADGLVFAAVASAVLALGWAVYGLALGGLRLPLPAAVVAGQLPLVLWAWAAGAPVLGFGWALLVTAAADGAVALWGKGLAVRVTAGAGAAVTGLVALLLGLVKSVSADGPLSAFWPGCLLLAGAAVALFGAWRARREFALIAGCLSGLAAVAAVGGVLRTAVPQDWSVVAYLACAVVLLAAMRARVSRHAGQGVLAAAGVVVAGAVLWALPPVGATLLGPLSLLADVWSGAPDGIREAMGVSVPWSGFAASPVVLAVVAGLLVAAHRFGPAGVPGAPVAAGAGWRGGAAAGALCLGWGALLVLPATLDAGYVPAVVVQVVLVAGLLLVAVRGLSGAPLASLSGVPVTALVCALAGAAGVGVLSLATEAATYAVFGVLLGLFVGAAVQSRVTVMRAVFACVAVMCGIVVASAVGTSLGLAAYEGAPVVLAVPAVTVLLGFRLRGGPVGSAVELAGAFAAVIAVAMAVSDAPFLALVLALCGVLAAGTAVRPERRQVAGYLSAVLFVTATWVRLAASDVSVPEAYTLPVTVPALVVGVLRRRRDPAASSWTAYGAGLAATLVPSLFAAWVDPEWVRPLLLGVAALVITLAGARFRLQALLLLGGTVLALVALHELAPYVVQVAGALPRWLPPALAGVLLLVVGATYEQRLRDARRLRDALGRMR
ncbi:SCO7613 C-terminal domain-containing membrane protein [Streptomyces sp. NPDC057136]|uniref:SCO7613 C-terminal domain-containing membrane protein n=1 Tax=Streptomyces sp. NPDC057136 TaxID=3346029 RepID=UPI003633310C